MTDRGQSLKSNLQKPLLQVRKEVESLLGLLTRGGAGSGHFGHAGRPGKVGGSRRAGVELKFRPIDYSFDQTGLITAWIDDEQVGSLAFGAPTKSKYFGKYDVELGWVVVREEHRRKGIATAMMDEFHRQFEGKRVVPYDTTKEGKAFMDAYVNRHYGPGPHPGTGTPQSVHGKGKGSPLRTGVFNPNDIERVQPMRGFCYERCAEWLVLEQGNEYEQARLVHGTVMGQGPLEGTRFTHAWIEIDDWVYDVSQDILSPKENYYQLAEAEDMVSYTGTEAAVNLLKEKNWGPWDEYLYNFKEEELKKWITGQ